MARGSENTPKPTKCWKKANDRVIVLYEQGPTHRANSKSRPKGYCGGAAGRSWQSHHLLCIASMGNRPAIAGLEDSLWITPWNINRPDNMLGMPQKKKYRQAYGKIEKMTSNPAQNTAWGTATSAITLVATGVPADIPCHNVDHLGGGSYKEDVDKWMKKIWNKFVSKAKDHQKDAAWIEDQLKTASQHWEGILLNTYGIRKGGTVKAWQTRDTDKDWAQPFSMAEMPKQMKWGKSLGKSLLKVLTRLK